MDQYDEAGQRILKEQGGQPVAAYLGGTYLDGSGLIEPVTIGGSVVGVVRAEAFEWVPLDHRGTALGDRDGTARLATPFGARASHPDLSAALDYVTKSYDADLGTVRMGVRDYDPRISRFWTPDPLLLSDIGLCAKSPVDCNLYSYARNNPVSLVDPTGLSPQDDALKQGLRPIALGQIKDFKAGGCGAAAGFTCVGVGLVNGKRTDLYQPSTASPGGVNDPSLNALGRWLTVFLPGVRLNPDTKKEIEGGVIVLSAVFPLLGEVRAALRTGVAGGGGASLLSQFARSTVDDVVESAERLTPGGQISEGARAIAKKLGHAQSGGYLSAFAGVRPTQANAEAIIRTTLESPARTFYGDRVIDVYNAAGQGVRFDRATNAFRGFLEGGLATQ